MAVSAAAVANAFLELSEKEGKSLTNMKLQKLVFLANGFYLAAFDQPLYYDETKAWQWGPVIPNLYKKLQKYGADIVTEKIESVDSIDLSKNDQMSKYVHLIWNSYKDLSASRLSQLTHLKNSPWDITWKNNQFGIIEQDTMKNYYQEFMANAA